MALGVRYFIGEIAKSDTAPLRCALREHEGVIEQNEIVSVTFTVQRPSGVLEVPVEGEVENNGEGFYLWTETEEAGAYNCQAQFALTNGEVRSVAVNFVVEDPFAPTSLEEIAGEDVWMRLEDCFDSFEGGPVLREETLSHFDERKIMRYIPEVLLDINVQEPKTSATLSDFAMPGSKTTAFPMGEPNSTLPLLSKGILCKTIMHMVRSYAEIPVPQGGQVVYQDRTRYAQIWQTIYKSEHEDYYTMVRLWKRGFLQYGKSALLVSSKAGRLFYGGVMRTRNVGRGFYYG